MDFENIINAPKLLLNHIRMLYSIEVEEKEGLCSFTLRSFGITAKKFCFKWSVLRQLIGCIVRLHFLRKTSHFLEILLFLQ